MKLALVLLALTVTTASADSIQYEWNGNQCDEVYNGRTLATNQSWDLCGGMRYQVVGGQCAYVTPNGVVLTTGLDPSQCMAN